MILAMVVLSAPAAAGTGKLKVTSSAIQAGKEMAMEQVFNGFGCTGGNVSPDLKWSGEPAGTKSFAVMMYDPDAPTGSGWWHWVAFNIPADVHELKAGAGDSEGKGMPQGSIQGRTDFGKPGYGGPCPPEGDKPHRYQFKIYALKDMIPVDKDAPAAMVGYYAGQMKLAEGSVNSRYHREKAAAAEVKK
jgi:Raf kinase inhibitor-like YbhB/YbcL family protein